MAGVGMFFITVIMFLLIIAMLITGIILLIVGLASKEKKKGCIIAGAILMGLSFIFGIILFFVIMISSAYLFAAALPNQL